MPALPALSAAAGSEVEETVREQTRNPPFCRPEHIDRFEDSTTGLPIEPSLCVLRGFLIVSIVSQASPGKARLRQKPAIAKMIAGRIPLRRTGGSSDHGDRLSRRGAFCRNSMVGMGNEPANIEIPDKLYYPIREVAEITGV